ncbi:GNAT family N-acetyltransferase [Falsiroseomonas tokyonensis]|uniref:GNAT family N-acetyltransferase n=1 Tax=Falsiroseomonas tokyonensis TaxID=430521 RepID=A0ABV7BVK1_9PROT|nr:GNAT family N-acetyltransferase [Falsiroseomonas tokyonensis]MBU8539708.1 GNAT family N-acetyltransferase [Falsiroseomonas tokyonensis]
MPLELRTARVGDVARISQLHADLWRVSHAGIFDADFIEDPLEAALILHWQEQLRGRKRPGQVVVAVTGHQLEGFAHAALVSGIAQIDHLEVREKMRGRGIGRSLLGLLAQRMRQDGARAATLAVPAGREGLPRFAKRFGGILGPVVQRERLGHAMPERSIAWADITRLIAACAN